MKEDSRTAGYVALIAGLVLIASGITSGSILLTGLNFAEKYTGSVPVAGIVVNIAIVVLTFVVGLGGLLVLAGGVLFLRRHATSGRTLIGLGGGSAILGLLFSMAEALYASGTTAPIFQQTYFTLYWIGAILATISTILSLRGRTKVP